MRDYRILFQFLLFGFGALAIFVYVKYINHQDYIYDECFKSSVPLNTKDATRDKTAEHDKTTDHLNLVSCMKANGYDYSAFSQCSFISDEEMCFTPSFLTAK